ncbi:MAG: toll/interleukin-1 receptor domain-containing protein [Chloroflexi bacterium]|nr:toll/interleukin-1 receptor domain-containing protein [Chloroflexota bacterium]
MEPRDSQSPSECAGLIAILSPDYTTSKYCPNELTRVYSAGKPIFPVIYRKLNFDQLPIEIQLTQSIDFSQIEDDDAFETRVSQLVQDIRQKVSAPIGDPPDRETQYLNSLIGELESRKGVLEYVELATRSADSPAIRPDTRIPTWDIAGFRLLANPHSQTMLMTAGRAK